MTEPKLFGSVAEVEAAFLNPKPKVQEAAPAMLRASPVAPTESNLGLPASQDLLGSIQGRLKELDAETDSVKSAEKLALISGEIAATQSRFYKEAQASAYSEFQVPRLMQVLDQNMQMDRNTPAFAAKYGMADSDETAAVRRSLQTAKAAADGSINERLAGNATYQQILASAKTLAAIGERKWMTASNRDEMLRQKGEEYMLGLTVEGKARAGIINPEAAADPAKFFMYMRGQPERIRNDMEETLRSREEDIPMLALQGSPTARYVLEKAEQGKVGPVAKDILRQGYAIADDTKLAAVKFEEMKKAGLFSSQREEELKQIALRLSPVASALGDKKEGQALAAETRAAIALKYMKWQNLRNFNADMTKLPSDEALPSFLRSAMADPAIAAKGRISKDEAIVLATRGVEKPAAQRNMQEFLSYYNSAAQKQSKSGLFAIDPFEITKTQTEGALSVAGFLGQALAKVGNVIAAPFETAGTAIGATARLPYELFAQPAGDFSTEDAFNKAIVNTIKKSSSADRPVPAAILKSFEGI